MNLFFGITVAPYGVDFCNALHEQLDCRMFHIAKPPFEMAFDVEAAERRCRFPLERYDRRPGLRSFRQLYRLVREERPKLVFVSEFSWMAVRMLLIRRLLGQSFRIISVCDDSPDMIQGNDFSRLHRLARRIVPRLVDDIILANPGAREWYRTRFGKGMFMPIISDEKLQREALADALVRAGQLREELLSGDRPVVLYVGRLIPLKNLENFLEAMRGIAATAVFVGDGPLRAALEARARLLGVPALFTGMKEGVDLAAWYDLADVLVLPSRQEAFGAVTGEALSAGCPVVVSSRAGSSFLVREGENGSVIEPGDTAAFVAALHRWTDNLAAPRPLSLRENLLPVSFRDLFDTLKNDLSNA